MMHHLRLVSCPIYLLMDKDKEDIRMQLKASKERVKMLERLLDQQHTKLKLEDSCNTPVQALISQLPNLAIQNSSGAHHACEAIQALQTENHKLRSTVIHCHKEIIPGHGRSFEHIGLIVLVLLALSSILLNHA